MRAVRFLASLSSLLVVLSPSLAIASTPPRPICAHPLAGGQCFGVFSLVSVTYVVITATYIAGALVIMKPQFDNKRWGIAIAATPVLSWLFAMLGFTIGGAADLLTYPHDESPFFYMDWFVMVFTLVMSTLYVVGSWRVRRPQASAVTAS